jgi:dTMP kinase
MISPTLTKSRFLVVEGIDGAGKSTHLPFMAEQIRGLFGVEVVTSREPGGTPLAEHLRGLLLHETMDAETEVLLAMAARRDHVTKLIQPTLQQGAWFLCDRFTDSTRAYQGGGGGVSLPLIDELNDSVCGDTQPDRVYVFDAPAELAASRRAGRGGADDRFEAQGVDYFRRVREVYLDRCRLAPDRYFLIDSTMSVSQIQSLLAKDIASL